MSTAPSSLKLVDPNKIHADEDERRRSSRYVITGRVTAVRKPGDLSEHRNRICSLELVDISDSGLGAICQEPVETNARITVFFPPHGPERGLDLYGKVTRCKRANDRYVVGIRFETQHQAA